MKEHASDQSRTIHLREVSQICDDSFTRGQPPLPVTGHWRIPSYFHLVIITGIFSGLKIGSFLENSEGGPTFDFFEDQKTFDFMINYYLP